MKDARAARPEKATDRAVIFDGDDTIWETQSIYDAAKRRFVSLLQQLGFRTPNVVELLDRIDAEHVTNMGFSKDRFPSSMVCTYELLCSMDNRASDQEVRQRIYSIGGGVFDTVPQLYPDTLDALNQLRAFYKLVLATKGDKAVQTQRLNALGLRPFFDAVYILPTKTDKEYRMIVRQINTHLSNVWVVGNSIRSDVNPALRAGLRVILIPRGAWEYERAEVEPGEVIVAHSLTEAVSIIKERDRAEAGRYNA